MGKIALGVAGLAAVWGVVSTVLDDGIEGCAEINGRAHWAYDDGTVSANPVQGLNFSDDGEGCYVWHGGGGAPDTYDLVMR